MIFISKFLLLFLSLNFNFTTYSLTETVEPLLSANIEHFENREDSWNWNKIDVKQIQFPKSFLWGTSICEYQASGATICNKSNWARWEATSISGKKPHIEDNQASGIACDHWNKYKEDIDLARNLGLNSFRFSIDWSKIEPVQGEYDADALDHYSDLCDYLIESGMTPMATLHHFVHPQWFEDLGAFEKEENIIYFVKFCKIVFEKFESKIKLWCTINEPTIYMFQGYLRGVFPPGRTNIKLALTVLKNLLSAHAQIYSNLKKMPGGDLAKIGLVHSYLVFKPYHKQNFLEKIPGLALNYIMNDLVLKFCSTGKIHYKIPFICNLKHNTNYPKPLDFIGLNYYSRVLMKSQLSLIEPLISTCYPNEVMTDMPYAIYPQGLYEAIKVVSDVGVPIYITENGIADHKDDRRQIFIERYLYALSKAIKDGYDVRGYYYWTLMDNFEWDMGFKMKFGLYKVNFETQERKLREGARIFKDIILSTKV